MLKKLSLTENRLIFYSFCSIIYSNRGKKISIGKLKKPLENC